MLDVERSSRFAMTLNRVATLSSTDVERVACGIFKLHTYRSYILYRFGVDKSIDAIAWSGVAAISTSFGLLRLFCRLAFAQSHTRLVSRASAIRLSLQPS